MSRHCAPWGRAVVGFVGVVVRTRQHAPRVCWQVWSDGASLWYVSGLRDVRTSWLIVAVGLGSVFGPRRGRENEGRRGVPRPARRKSIAGADAYRQRKPNPAGPATRSGGWPAPRVGIPPSLGRTRGA